MMASPLKRHAPREFDEVDSENIDPLTVSSPSKKARGFDFNDTRSAKTPAFALTPAKKPAQYVQRAQAVGQKRKAEGPPLSTSNNETLSNKRAQPLSAPAGRSPKSKKTGILSRRRMTASPFTRINPPAFSTSEVNTGLPFSIDAALAGTVSDYKSKSKSTHRKAWQFEIHEDSPTDEMTNLMEHSTCTLDISDDESRAATKEDKDNKENIPPIDGPAATAFSTQIIASRRDVMTDDTRSPLGDLDAADFYADGCDWSSVFIVGAEDAGDNIEEKCHAVPDLPESSPPARLRANAVTNDRDAWKEIIAQLAPNGPSEIAKNQHPLANDDPKLETTEIQIWESESAKGDDDWDNHEPVTNGIDHQSLLA